MTLPKDFRKNKICIGKNRLYNKTILPEQIHKICKQLQSILMIEQPDTLLKYVNLENDGVPS